MGVNNVNNNNTRNRIDSDFDTNDLFQGGGERHYSPRRQQLTPLNTLHVNVNAEPMQMDISGRGRNGGHGGHGGQDSIGRTIYRGDLGEPLSPTSRDLVPMAQVVDPSTLLGFNLQQHHNNNNHNNNNNNNSNNSNSNSNSNEITVRHVMEHPTSDSRRRTPDTSQDEALARQIAELSEMASEFIGAMGQIKNTQQGREKTPEERNPRHRRNQQRERKRTPQHEQYQQQFSPPDYNPGNNQTRSNSYGNGRSKTNYEKSNNSKSNGYVRQSEQVHPNRVGRNVKRTNGGRDLFQKGISEKREKREKYQKNEKKQK